MIGQTLAHYKILEKIGQGGMGEVYLAEDTKLDRKIALKVLPSELAEDEDRRARFEREAKALAALNHPGIVQVFSVEEAEGVHFITMELVQGKTLAELIPKKGMPLEKFFEIAIPLADSVAAAHENGIVHRDMKPANVMIADDRRVKVLDFGLARSGPLVGVDIDYESPTDLKTQEGVLAGTLHYMSPEQAEGKRLDHRSDIFSLGTMLYEMITGRLPFQGDSATSILASVLNDTPVPINDIKSGVPRELAKIVRRCMAKDVEDRLQATKDLRNELRELKHEVESGETSAMASISVTRLQDKPTLLASYLAVAVAAVLATYLVVRPAEETDRRASAETSFNRFTSEPGEERWPSLSPDGRSVAYSSNPEGNWDIYVRRVGGGNSFNLTRDSDADDTHPAFSPDGERIAFRSERDGGGIFLMGATGESVRRLTDFGYDPAWSPDGSDLAFVTVAGEPGNLSGKGQLWLADAATGAVKLLHDEGAAQPQWSPNGYRIALWYAGIWTVAAEGGEAVRATEEGGQGSHAVWSPDGTYLYFSSRRGGASNIWRLPLNEETGRAVGQAEPVTIGGGGERVEMSLSADGRRMVYVERNFGRDLVRLDFDPDTATLKRPLPLVEGRITGWPDVSPDGDWVVFQEIGQPESIGLVRSDGSGYVKLSEDASRNRHPRWSPDGTRIAFDSTRGGPREFGVWLVDRDGSGLEPLTSPGGMYPVWSPDGASLASAGIDIGSTILPAEPGSENVLDLPVLDEEDSFFIAWSWSSDGKLLAGWRRRLSGEDSGILVYSFETGTFESLTDFGRNPVWLSDNRRLIFTDRTQGKIFMLQRDTKRIRELQSSIPTTYGLATISPTDRHIYTAVATQEADIWMLTLDEEP